MTIIDLIKAANHNLLRNKTRTLLTILAIFIGSFTIILSNAINSGVNSFIDKQVESIGGEGFVEVFPAAMYEQVAAITSGDTKVKEYNGELGSATTASISNDDLKKMQAVDGVEELELFHILSPEWMTGEKTDKKYNVSLEYFPDTNFKIDLSAGRLLDNETEKYEILITEDWLEPLGYSNAEEALGQMVTIAIKQTAKCYLNPNDCLATTDATIIGVQAPGILSVGQDLHINESLDNELYSLATAGLPESALAEMNVIAIGNVEPDKLGQIREEFREIGYEIMTIDDTVGMIRIFLDAILIVFNVFGGIALIAASIGIVNTLYMSVQERTREIGLMKAMGLSNGKIFLSFSLEAIFLGFWGSVIGILFSMLIGYGINDIAHQTFLADFPTFELVIFEPGRMAIITLVIMFIAFIAGTAPARKASRENPIDALRYE